MLKINNLQQQTGMFASLLFFTWILYACQSDAPVAQPAPPVAAAAATTAPPEVDKNYLLGKFDPAKDSHFVAVAAPYSDKPGMRLRKETMEAFERMWKAAQNDGITLKIISSTRNFEQQKNIWEGKWARFAAQAPKPKDRALKILEYSSMPGSSRHHWGTDIDLNDLNNPTFEAGGKYEKVYAWLVAHAHEYGFCQPYTAGRPHGYHEEKWHWTYLPLSKSFTETYRQTIKDADISGFIGAETASEIGIVEHYVLGINQGCL